MFAETVAYFAGVLTAVALAYAYTWCIRYKVRSSFNTAIDPAILAKYQ